MKTDGIVILLLIACTAGISLPLAAQEDAVPEEQQRWAFLPVIGYNAEMGWIMGALGVHFLPIENEEIHPSSIDCYIIGTSKKQYQLNFMPDLYFGHGKYHFKAELIPEIWRANFYGIGQDPADEGELYEMDAFETTMDLEMFFDHGLYAGLNYRYRWEDIEPEGGGILDLSGLQGTFGGKVTGLGLSGGLDTRDNRNSAYQGWYAKYQFMAYRGAIGSDADYNVSEIDVRTYFPLPEESAIGIAGFARFMTGTIPFTELSTDNGVDRLRGIERGLYRDNHLLCLQTEYRKQFHPRFGMTLFAEAGEVAPKAEDFTADEIVYSTGIGFRIGINPEQRFNIRIDISRVNNEMGFVIYIREAF